MVTALARPFVHPALDVGRAANFDEDRRIGSADRRRGSVVLYQFAGSTASGSWSVRRGKERRGGVWGRGGGGGGSEPEHVDEAFLVVRREWFGELGEEQGGCLWGKVFGYKR